MLTWAVIVVAVAGILWWSWKASGRAAALGRPPVGLPGPWFGIQEREELRAAIRDAVRKAFEEERAGVDAGRMAGETDEAFGARIGQGPRVSPNEDR